MINHGGEKVCLIRQSSNHSHGGHHWVSWKQFLWRACLLFRVFSNRKDKVILAPYLPPFLHHLCKYSLCIPNILPRLSRMHALPNFALNIIWTSHYIDPQNGSLKNAKQFFRCRIRARVFNSHRSQFECQLFLFLAWYPLENVLTLLSLHFLIFIMGILPPLS